MKTLNQKMKDIGPARRKKVEARAAALIADLPGTTAGPKTHPSTDCEGSRHQPGWRFRLEERSDFLLSTLRKTVEAMDGNLSLVVVSHGYRNKCYRATRKGTVRIENVS